MVDVSGSIAEGGHLETVKLALSTLALEDAAVGSGAMAENSRASLMTFGGDAEPETIVARAASRDRAAQGQWLIRVNALAAVATGSFIYDAVNSAYQGVLSTDSDGRENAIVVLSDGIDGMVGECRPARADETTEYCIGDSGDPVLCANLPEARRSSDLGRICEAVPSKTDPYVCPPGTTGPQRGAGRPESPHHRVRLARFAPVARAGRGSYGRAVYLRRTVTVAGD